MKPENKPEVSISIEDIREAGGKIFLTRETAQSVLEKSCQLNPYECMKLTQAMFGERVKEATHPVFTKIREWMASKGCSAQEAAEQLIAKAKIEGSMLSFVVLGTACKMSYVNK